jgi:hypothetical protein
MNRAHAFMLKQQQGQGQDPTPASDSDHNSSSSPSRQIEAMSSTVNTPMVGGKAASSHRAALKVAATPLCTPRMSEEHDNKSKRLSTAIGAILSGNETHTSAFSYSLSQMSQGSAGMSLSATSSKKCPDLKVSSEVSSADDADDPTLVSVNRKRQLEVVGSFSGSSTTARRQRSSGSRDSAKVKPNMMSNHAIVEQQSEQSSGETLSTFIAFTPRDVSPGDSNDLDPVAPAGNTSTSTPVAKNNVVLDTSERLKRRMDSDCDDNQCKEVFSPSERQIQNLTLFISTPLLKSCQSGSQNQSGSQSESSPPTPPPGERGRVLESLTPRQLANKDEEVDNLLDETGLDESHESGVEHVAWGVNGSYGVTSSAQEASNLIILCSGETDASAANKKTSSMSSGLPIDVEQVSHNAVSLFHDDDLASPLPTAPVATDYNSLFGVDSGFCDITVDEICSENIERKRLLVLRQLNSNNILRLEINSTHLTSGTFLSTGVENMHCEEIRLPVASPQARQEHSQLLLSVLSHLSVIPLSRHMVEWVTMQLLWILWTFVSYERVYPEEYLGKLLTRRNVFEAVAHRFSQYTGTWQQQTGRPDMRGVILRKVKFKDTKGSGSMSPLQRCVDIHSLVFPIVLCVAMTPVKQSTQPVAATSATKREVIQYSIALTDGWWWVRAKVDADINSRLVQTRKLREGDKIVVFAATFEESDDAPLCLGGQEVSGHSGRTVMKLCYNAVRKAKHDAKVRLRWRSLVVVVSVTVTVTDSCCCCCCCCYCYLFFVSVMC